MSAPARKLSLPESDTRQLNLAVVAEHRRLISIRGVDSRLRYSVLLLFPEEVKSWVAWVAWVA